MYEDWVVCWCMAILNGAAAGCRCPCKEFGRQVGEGACFEGRCSGLCAEGEVCSAPGKLVSLLAEGRNDSWTNELGVPHALRPTSNKASRS